MIKETTFYQELQKKEGLDLRDNRGKTLDLAFVLLGVIIGLLRCRDGKLSSIHRSMKNMNSALCKALLIEDQVVVSRSHLPIVLSKVSLTVFESLLFNHYGLTLCEEEKEWFAADGKELRGSIEKGDKRGEAIVQIVKQKDRSVQSQSFYSGKKESEKSCLKSLISDSELGKQKITADALHLYPGFTDLIEAQNGTYLVGLKNNQSILLKDLKTDIKCIQSLIESDSIERGHGRIDQRSYKAYDISWSYVDSRWEKSNF